MKKKRNQRRLLIACILITLISIFATKFPFWKYSEDIYETTAQEFFSSAHIYRLLPLMTIMLVSTIGILVCIKLRKREMEKDPRYSHFADARTEKNGGSVLPRQEKSRFMTLRWRIMIIFSLVEIFAGILLSFRIAVLYFPTLSCGANTQQLVETSCYFLANPSVLLEMPILSIITFFASTIGFALILGRVICGFLCPMGLLQDVLDHIRTKRSIEGVRVTEKMYAYITPLKWLMVFLLLGLGLIGGSFCNICPALAVSPALGGMQVSLYISGFMLIIALIGSFFKRRFWCNVCPVGFLLGLAHKISPFRIKKDVTACTECGACYEACPMGIKIIYTEREKADVTDQNCIMCGECVRKCPEDNALAVTFAGYPLYKATRRAVMQGYAKPVEADILALAGLRKKLADEPVQDDAEEGKTDDNDQN